MEIKRVTKSTFADDKCPSAFYEALFGKLYQLCREVAPGHKFRFKAKLFSLAASTVKLRLAAFPWASFRAKHLHTLLDHDGDIPAFLKEKIRRSFLPACSPELNLDELANQDIKSNIPRRGKPDDKPKLTGMRRAFLRSRQRRPERVKECFEGKYMAYAKAV